MPAPALSKEMMMRRILPLVLLAVLALTGCAPGQRYDAPPDSTWKERSAYYFFQIDPKGWDNSQVGYTDTEPILESTGAGFRLSAVDARVTTDLTDTEDRGYARDDYFRATVAWATDADGFVRVENRC